MRRKDFQTGSGLSEDNSPMSCVLVLLMAVGVVLKLLDLFPRGCLYPSFYIQGGWDYNEGNRVGYNMIAIRTLSLLTYFTHIFIDRIIYALVSMPWSSEIFWMLGWVIADPSLGFLSPCEVVPRVLIPIKCQAKNGNIPLIPYFCNWGHVRVETLNWP
jgi:hypothetical protein